MVIFFGHTFSVEVLKMKQLHGNSSRFVRELMQEERAFISKRIKSTDRNIRDRARVVDLSSKGYSVPQIMEELRRCRNYVSGWIDRFNNEGVKGLETKKRSGRPGIYTGTEEQKVMTLINTRRLIWISISTPGTYPNFSDI